jgi:hypothetical protein
LEQLKNAIEEQLCEQLGEALRAIPAVVARRRHWRAAIRR